MLDTETQKLSFFFWTEGVAFNTFNIIKFELAFNYYN